MQYWENASYPHFPQFSTKHTSLIARFSNYSALCESVDDTRIKQGENGCYNGLDHQLEEPK